MPAYRVLIKPAAEKELDALPESVHQRVTARILGLADEPRPHGSRKLRGLESYRLRVGDYPPLYTVEDATSTVTVYAVAHRREAYR